ncbi:MAG: aspartate aminotransferase family protein [Solirubrobacteraceae bacterium]
MQLRRRANGLRERARRVLPGGYGRSTFAVGPDSPYAVRGDGYRLWDDTGAELIDLNNNFTALVHGHANEHIAEAATAAMRAGVSFGLPNEHELEHAEALLARLPDADVVRYTNSGTEAVMTALRIARAHTGRNRCIVIRDAYHGTSDGVLAAGGPRSRRGVPAGVLAETTVLGLNDRASLGEAVERHGTELAAVLIDLLPNRAGLVAADPEYVQELVRLRREHGVLLISDEVIAFRLRWDGWSASYDLAPDLTVLGKLIGGGFPVGAIAGRRAVMQELNPLLARGLEHGGTFSGNPVTMAAGLASLDLLDPPAVERLNRLGDEARAHLAESIAPLGWTVRGTGSLLRPWPPGTAAERTDRARQLWWAAYGRGLLLNPSGLVALSTPMDADVTAYVVAELTAAAADVAGGWRMPGADGASARPPDGPG